MLYFPFLPFLETQNREHVARFRKLKGMAESLRLQSSLWQWEKHNGENPVEHFVKRILKVQQALADN